MTTTIDKTKDAIITALKSSLVKGSTSKLYIVRDGTSTVISGITYTEKDNILNVILSPDKTYLTVKDTDTIELRS
jgi:hypothetical protein